MTRGRKTLRRSKITAPETEENTTQIDRKTCVMVKSNTSLKTQKQLACSSPGLFYIYCGDKRLSQYYTYLRNLKFTASRKPTTVLGSRQLS